MSGGASFEIGPNVSITTGLVQAPSTAPGKGGASNVVFTAGSALVFGQESTLDVRGHIVTGRHLLSLLLLALLIALLGGRLCARWDVKVPSFRSPTSPDHILNPL